jgi:CheY-like chemotaxis protein
MKPKSFMIIDDSAIDRFVHTKLLDFVGLSGEIQDFSNGMNALDYLRANSENEANLPDVILLDIMMPEMDGFDFLVHFEELKKKLVKVPYVFMLSSSEDENDQTRADKNSNVQRLLKKPFSPKSFKQHLANLKF